MHAPDEALGRSRGGLSTKLHLHTDASGRPLVILATAGQRHEVTQLVRLLDQGAVKRTSPNGRPGRGRPRRRPAALAGDKGYSHPSMGVELRRRGIRAVIPTKSTSRAFAALTGRPIGRETRWNARWGGSNSSAGSPPATRSEG